MEWLRVSQYIYMFRFDLKEALYDAWSTHALTMMTTYQRHSRLEEVLNVAIEAQQTSPSGRTAQTVGAKLIQLVSKETVELCHTHRPGNARHQVEEGEDDSDQEILQKHRETRRA